jgi:hypothetical protein
MDEKTKKRYYNNHDNNVSLKKNYHVLISFFSTRITLYIYFCQATTNRPEEDELVWRLEENSSEFTFFGFTEILHATCNFSIKNQLGRGGFGPVYKVNANQAKDNYSSYHII